MSCTISANERTSLPLANAARTSSLVSGWSLAFLPMMMTSASSGMFSFRYPLAKAMFALLR